MTLPVQRLRNVEIDAMTHGISLQMGTPVRQNPRGDLLGVVMNVGDVSKKTTRVSDPQAVFCSASPSSRAIASRIMNFCGLPVTVIGSSVTKRTYRGTL